MTAKEYFIEHLSGEPLHQDVVIEAMIEFAKMHVEAALKEALEKSETFMDGSSEFENFKNSILNAYPLDLIK